MGRFAAGLVFLLFVSAIFSVYIIFGVAISASLKAFLNQSELTFPLIITAVILLAGAIYVLGWLVQEVGRRGR
jgi:cytochrome bd-type quinol oxidase subunit 1